MTDLTRRETLRRGAGAVGIASVIAVGGAAIARGEAEDAEFLALYGRYLAAKEEARGAFDAYNASEEAWYASPDSPPYPKVECTYGGAVYHTFTSEEQIQNCQTRPETRERYLAEFRRKKAEYEAASAACGLTQAQAHSDEMVDRVWALFEKLAACPVFTAPGLRIKLELLAEGLRAGSAAEHIILADTSLEAAGRLAV